MSEDYRQYAAQCLALAKAAGDTPTCAHFLAMAELWRSMAQKLESREPAVESEDRGAA